MTTTLDPAQQLLFIDAAISDSDTLLAGIDPAVAIVRLTADSPALVQIAAAVSGLSPVIIIVLIPIFLISANFSLTPAFTMSFKKITPIIL